jgi:nicotinamidase/pyrazinamidase
MERLKKTLSIRRASPPGTSQARSTVTSLNAPHAKNGGDSTPTNNSMFVYNSGLARSRIHTRAMLLIDPQNDFVETWGSLTVPGALEDSKRVAEAISANLGSIDEIFVTLDTHQKFHIAHPLFWISGDGSHHPAPYTQITVQEVQAGKWKATREEFHDWALFYVKELDKQKKFTLTIWPDHCLVGTRGHSVVDCLSKVLHEWEETNNTAVSFLMKGTNALSEHYSAFKAEVVRPDDPHTKLNERFIAELNRYDEIIVAGQALSHCVNFSVRDLVETLPASSRRKIIVLSDGCSAIKGFEEAAKAFRDDMEKEGVRFLTTNVALPNF